MTLRAARPEALPAADTRLVVVEASAGTGKTYFLEHRVVDLVLTGAELGQILLVTFTDKAVAELRMRIRDLFDRLARQTESDAAEPAWEIDDAARARLQAAVTAFDNAPIFTIHGYCYRVLVEDAFAARRLFEQTQVTDEVAFDRAFAVLLRERFANAGPERELLAAYLERGDTVDALRDLLLACARNGAEPRAFELESVRALGEALREAFGTPAAREAIAAKIKEKRWLPKWLGSMADAVEAWNGTPAGVLAMCGAIREDGPKLLKHAQKAGLAATVEVLQRAIDTVSLDEVIASAMLPPILARVAEDKAETGQFDYNDMLKLVRDALHGPRGAELGARLRARTPWVMIDEFQDTDEVQWDIFRTVWTAEGARGLTIVGDPKQAIYGFRGADVATYERARAELLAMGARQVTLDVNRRSTPALVDAVNRILLPDPLAKALFNGAIAYEPVRASGTVQASGAPVRVLAITGELSHDEARAALATAIASEIDALGVGGVRRSDCMVLVRNAAEAGQIAAALRARGIACALVEGDDLFDTREAHELRSVLAAIAAPRDRSARLRALRTRFFDVPWSELMRVVDAPDHHPLIARLFDWAALAARRAYEPLFRRLIEDSRFAERALVLGGGERAIVNTWHLIELLLEEVARSRSDLHELVVRLERWIAGGAELPDDRDVQRAETDADAVRILTVHKAKGLEAPYVFFYGGLSAPPPSRVFALHESDHRRLLVGQQSQQSDSTKLRLTAEREAEDQRLAYVALTRAKLRLYLPIYPTPDKRSMYAHVQRCLAQVAVADPAAFARVEIGTEAPLSPAPADALADFAPLPAPDAPELLPIRGARARLEMVSYTRLAHEAEAATAIDAAEFAVEITADAAPEPAQGELPRGIDSGLFLHALFEHADLEAIRRARDAAAWGAEPSTVALLAMYGREHGIAEAYYAHAARIVYRTLAHPLDLAGRPSLRPLVHATAIAREVEFAYPLPNARGLVTGFIDALVAYDDELWVLDYKSDSLAGDPAKTVLEHVQAHYKHQHRLYALAANRLRGERRLGGMLFAFVRYGVTAVLPIDDAHLDEWARWLATVRTDAEARS